MTTTDEEAGRTATAADQPVDEFRHEVRSWLAARLPDEWCRPAFPQTLPPTEEDRDAARISRLWHDTLHLGGWIAPGWPREHGGRGLDLRRRVVFAEELALRRAPVPIGFQGIDLLGPTLLRWATPEQRARFLPGILSASEIWCQGYSEPDAGSDLASIATTARRDGDVYVVNGQKVWTSFGDRATWCFLLARTGSSESRHKGLSFFLVEMSTPGIEWRPVRQITGTADFGELFLDDVRIPASQRIGGEGDGWRVAMASLDHERILGANVAHLRTRLEALIALAHRRDLTTSATVRQGIAAVACRVRGVEGLQARALRRDEDGAADAGAWASLLKLAATELRQEIAELAGSMLGGEGMLAPSADMDATDAWRLELLEARACTIYSGTSQIQRNIVAERVLSLPREPAG